ncbi:MAG: DUF433 domain-containing protein [Saprospiraceae bacterium]|nr:DUF433 domain-containing protein [Saprospiraceae bacterium]
MQKNGMFLSHLMGSAGDYPAKKLDVMTEGLHGTRLKIGCNKMLDVPGLLFLARIGKPIINWTRITVEWVVRKILDRFSIHDILGTYPHFNMASGCDT